MFWCVVDAEALNFDTSSEDSAPSDEQFDDEDEDEGVETVEAGYKAYKGQGTPFFQRHKTGKKILKFRHDIVCMRFRPILPLRKDVLCASWANRDGLYPVAGVIKKLSRHKSHANKRVTIVQQLPECNRGKEIDRPAYCTFVIPKPQEYLRCDETKEWYQVVMGDDTWVLMNKVYYLPESKKKASPKVKAAKAKKKASPEAAKAKAGDGGGKKKDSPKAAKAKAGDGGGKKKASPKAKERKSTNGMRASDEATRKCLERHQEKIPPANVITGTPLTAANVITTPLTGQPPAGAKVAVATKNDTGAVAPEDITPAMLISDPKRYLETFCEYWDKNQPDLSANKPYDDARIKAMQFWKNAKDDKVCVPFRKHTFSFRNTHFLFRTHICLL